jgi:hypothetical protein
MRGGGPMQGDCGYTGWVSHRGDSERDDAALDAELAHEHRRKGESSRSNRERDQEIEIAGLYAEAAQLRERLARIYDKLDDLITPGG